MTQRMELPLTPEDKTNLGFARSMQNLATATGELIMTQGWPAELELDCAPYAGRADALSHPKAAYPLFHVVHQSDQNYEVSARFPSMVRSKSSSTRVVEATWAQFRLEGPPRDMWGWRIGQIVVEQHYWCKPEEVPPTPDHPARKALMSLALRTQKLREGVPPVQDWPMRWRKIPRNG